MAALSDPMRHLLVLRFALLNLVTFGFLVVAQVNGYVHVIVEADNSGLSIAIFAVFISGLGLCSYKIAVAKSLPPRLVFWSEVENNRSV